MSLLAALNNPITWSMTFIISAHAGIVEIDGSNSTTS